MSSEDMELFHNNIGIIIHIKSSIFSYENKRRLISMLIYLNLIIYKIYLLHHLKIILYYQALNNIVYII